MIGQLLHKGIGRAVGTNIAGKEVVLSTNSRLKIANLA